MAQASYSVPTRFLLFFFVGLSFTATLDAQPALEALLNRIPASETGDANRYSLTDVQYALGLDLDWNPLLRRAQLRSAEDAPLLTLVAGSEVGYVGADWVRWPQSPQMNNGQLFVSKEVLVSLFAKFPDLAPQGWEETPTSSELVEEFPGEPTSSDPDSSSFPGATRSEIRKLLALVHSQSEPALSASAQPRNATQVFVEALSEALTEKGIGFASLPANAEETSISEAKADAILAVWIKSGAPAPPTAFFIYDSPAVSSGPSTLTEWGRVDPAQQEASRRLALKLNASFLDRLGESRTLGLRKGPIRSLQGRPIPSVMVFVGADSSQLEADLRNMAATIAESLAAPREEG